MVLADSDVLVRIVHGTSLADDDVSGLYDLSAELLETESFALRLTPVLGTTLTFFMCHFSFLLLMIKR